MPLRQNGMNWRRRIEMKIEQTKAVGSTRLPPSRRDGGWRVQFPDASGPNCHGARTTGICRRIAEDVLQQSVSGVTPETTRGTRMLPTFSSAPLR
jgi:hypothetical protein